MVEQAQAAAPSNPGARSAGDRTPRAPLLASAVAAIGLAAASLWGADAWFADDARQRAADQWAAFQRCLLGEDASPQQPPSVRLRGISLGLAGAPAAKGAAPWLARCRPAARALDQTLARPALRKSFAELPRAAEVVRTDAALADRCHALDSLWRAVREADLPLPSLAVPDGASPPLPAPPRPAIPLLRSSSLQPLAQPSPEARGPWELRKPVGTGHELRLLAIDDDRPKLCRIGDDPAGKPFGATSCRPLPWTLSANAVTMKLGDGVERGAALLYVQEPGGADGVYDASSGQRIWRPRSAAETFVRSDGEALILYGVPRRNAERAPSDGPVGLSSPAVDHVRLVRFRPGRAPSNHRLSEPPGTHFALLEDQVLSWRTDNGYDVLRSRKLESGGDGLARARKVGILPRRASLRSSCATTGTRSLLFAGLPSSEGRRSYALALAGEGRPPRTLQAGPGPGSVSLTCEEGMTTVVAWTLPLVLHRWRCSADGCATERIGPFAAAAHGAEEVVAAAMGNRLLVAWRSARAGLRMRLGPPERLSDDDVVLLDPEALADLAPTALHLFTHRGVALLIIRSDRRGTFAIRIDEQGQASSLGAPPSESSS